ncbi:unnamed protein product [Pseudo-nitzschia multistriata]|uniref:Uncharacterized protein n=1 Tax=Pseudo-nitzschia multistriata TaxID=183589 RepID=A0A448Z1W9_9STRA|nr:unnamed protein product [Pseudo-nitzschia multistriata]
MMSKATIPSFAFPALFLTAIYYADAFGSSDPMALSTVAHSRLRDANHAPFAPHKHVSASRKNTVLRMGFLDSVFSRFMDKREGDFVRLEDMNEQFFGPGPALLLYSIPDAIEDDEVMDMLSDGAPVATSKGISLARITATDLQANACDGDESDGSNQSLLDLSLNEALDTVVQRETVSSLASTATIGKVSTNVEEPSWTGLQEKEGETPSKVTGSPVVLFSGFSNKEMMASYNILGEEIYKETASYGQPGVSLACATAVPNAMEKPLRQVLTEISGDHAEAMKEEE